jgi:branched-chain amino acid transport system permease protein
VRASSALGLRRHLASFYELRVAPREAWIRFLLYLAVTVVLWAVLPLLGAQYQLRLANLIIVDVIAALGVNIILGYAGLVSIAHGATMAIGAYTSALLMIRFHWPFALAFAAACAISAALSGLVGILGTRIKTNYFMLVTIALAAVVRLVIVNETAITGGPSGLFDVPAAGGFGWSADTDAQFYLLGIPFSVLAFYLAQRLRSSRAGRAMIALRLNESAARMSGVDVNRYRIAAMALGGAYLGAAGSLFAHLVRFLGPESFGLSLALLLTLMVVVGGIGSNAGTVLSVAVLVVLTSQLQDVGNAWVLYYGVLIMVMLVVAPRGVASIATGLYSRARRLAGRESGNADTHP